MSLRKLAVALLTVFALGAIVATSALATENWKATTGSWYTGASPGTKLAVGTGTLDLTAEGIGFVLTSTIAASPIRFEAFEVAAKNCSASNPTSTTATVDCEALIFKKVSVSGPAATGCSTPSTITTKEFTGRLGMNKAGTTATIEFTPKAHVMVSFATVELTGSCANAGLYKVTGVVYAQATNATGVFNGGQGLATSESIQLDAGTAISLKFGANGAFLNGSSLVGAGVVWSGKES